MILLKRLGNFNTVVFKSLTNSNFIWAFDDLWKSKPVVRWKGWEWQIISPLRVWPRRVMDLICSRSSRMFKCCVNDLARKAVELFESILFNATEILERGQQQQRIWSSKLQQIYPRNYSSSVEAHTLMNFALENTVFSSEIYRLYEDELLELKAVNTTGNYVVRYTDVVKVTCRNNHTRRT